MRTSLSFSPYQWPKRPVIIALVTLICFLPLITASFKSEALIQDLSNYEKVASLADLLLPTQYGISQAIGQNNESYHVQTSTDALRFVNGSMQAQFETDVVTIQRGEHEWSIVFAGVGYGDDLIAPDTPIIQSVDNRIEYLRGNITEWYINGSLGIQQGFTLHSRLQAGSGDLTLALNLGGSLTPEIIDGTLLLKNSDGNMIMTYSGLMAYDATGREFPAEMNLQTGKLLLRVDDRGAIYPLTVDPFIQVGKLTATDGAQDDIFGGSVSISGNVVVIGASGTNSNQGAAYVFEKSGANWSTMTETGKLTASDGVSGDSFGSSVSISGDVIVVGANGTNTNQGAVYVFQKPGANWTNMTQTAKLTASDGVSGDRFGLSVSISGNVIVVGSYFPASYLGKAYVFEKPGTNWTNMTAETAKLTASDAVSGDTFGFSVSISGDVIIVSANLKNSVYVYQKPGATWTNMTQTAKLTTGGGDAGFGVSVSISGDVIVVGSSNGQGAVYVYQKPGANWTSMTAETAKLTGSDSVSGDNFGSSVSISGDVVVVGAIYDDVTAPNMGSAYVFQKPGANWTSMTAETAKLTASDGVSGDYFGSSVSIEGDVIVIGANRGNANVLNSGSAYLFEDIPVISFANTTVSQSEGNSGTTNMDLTVQASVAVVGDVTVNVGIDLGGADSGDLGTLPTTVTIPDGQASATISIPVLGDTIGEDDESFTVNLTDINSGKAAVVTPDSATGTILNDDKYSTTTSFSVRYSQLGDPVTSSIFGETMLITVDVQSNFGIPTGSVVISDGGNSCTVNLSGTLPVSVGWCELVFSSGGVKTLTATYNGDSQFQSSSVNAQHTVEKAATTTIFTSFATTSQLGSPANFTVLVTSAVVTSGLVTVTDGNQSCETTLSGGSGACEIMFDSVGQRSVTAIFNSNENFKFSSSGALVHTVNEFGSTLFFAAPDIYAVEGNQTLNISVARTLLRNDIFPDGANVSTSVLEQPVFGDLTLNSDGSFTYDPGSNFSTTDVFSYRLESSGSVVSAATVTLVNATNEDQLVLPSPTDLEVKGDRNTTPVVLTFNWQFPSISIGLESFLQWHNFVLRDAETGQILVSEWYSAAEVCTSLGCAVTLSDEDLTTGVFTSTTYTWEVRTWYDRLISDWEQGPSFELDVKRPELTKGTISASAESGVLLISFPDNPNSLWYQIYVGTQPPNRQLRYLRWFNKITDGVCQNGTCQIVVDQLGLELGGYEIWVQTWGPAGFQFNGDAFDQLGGWAGPISFLVEVPAPTAPTSQTPTFTESGLPTFHWQRGQYSTWFQIWTYVEADPSTWYENLEWISAPKAGCGGLTETTCSYTPDFFLEDGQTYIWYLKVWGPAGYYTGDNPDDTFNQWAGGGSYTVDITAPGVPEGLTPTQEVHSTADLRYRWDHLSEAVWYQFELKQTNELPPGQEPITFSNWYPNEYLDCRDDLICDWYPNEDLDCRDDLICELRLDGLGLPNGSYEFRVRAWNGAVTTLNENQWSAWQEFTVRRS